MSIAELEAQIQEVQQQVGQLGQQVRAASSSGDEAGAKAAKEAMAAAQQQLKQLRSQVKKLKKAAKKAAGGGQAKKKKKKQQGESKSSGLGLSVRKLQDFPTWYSQVIEKSEMISKYRVSGCYILRPWAFNIWELITEWFDGEIKKLGVKNAMFPLFVTKQQLELEEDHVAGFAPEVAWVTRSGTTELAEPIALRPTSETIMYPYFSKWIQSHRDLPLRLNQWTNVVRWEFKNPTPFIRTREFLWQEGHTAFATQEEADQEVLDILDLYARVYEELMAIPVIKGRKSEKERFPGGLYTTTVEAFVSATGRSVQGATSHCLGTNFAKMFNIEFETESGGAKKKVVQNSWGLSTRTIGVMIMVHGDDKGLVLPPRLAPTQVVIVWVYKAADDEATVEAMRVKANAMGDALKSAGVRVYVENRTDKTAGWKYTHWELKGVPLRIELGAAEMADDTVVLAHRHDGTKKTHPAANVVEQVQADLLAIQDAMLDKARRKRDSHLSIVTTWDDFVEAIDRGHAVLAPWCERIDTEDWVKKTTKAIFEERRQQEAEKRGEAKIEISAEEAAKSLSSGAKTLCIPFAQPDMPADMPCFTSVEGSPGFGQKASVWCLWGRSY